jgi:hypothetical protein
MLACFFYLKLSLLALVASCLSIPPRTDKQGRASMASRSEALACLSCLKKSAAWTPWLGEKKNALFRGRSYLQQIVVNY